MQANMLSWTYKNRINLRQISLDRQRIPYTKYFGLKRNTITNPVDQQLLSTGEVFIFV